MRSFSKLFLLAAFTGLALADQTDDFAGELLKKHRKTSTLTDGFNQGLQSMGAFFDMTVSAASPNVQKAKAAAKQMADTATAAMQDPELDKIKKLMRGELKEMDQITDLMNSKGMLHLKQTPEYVHKVLEAFPMLGTMPSLKAAMNRRLGDAETLTMFDQGMKEILTTMKNTIKTAADPDGMMSVMSDLMDNGDEEVQRALEGAASGDHSAAMQVDKLVNKKLFPGIDTSALQEMGSPEKLMARYKALQDSMDIMRQIDHDSEMSEVIRNPVNFLEVLQESGLMGKK